MVVEMKKLNLIALSYDRDKILNALERTGAVQIKQHAPSEYASAVAFDTEALNASHVSAENALQILQSQTLAYASAHKISYKIADDLEVSYSEFLEAGKREEDYRALIQNVNALRDARTALQAELNRLQRALKAAVVYECSDIMFSQYRRTRSVVYKLGTVEERAFETLKNAFDAAELVAYRVLARKENVVLGVCYAVVYEKEAEKLLSEAGFSACPYRTDETGAQMCASIRSRIEYVMRELESNATAFFAMKEKISALKLYSDYLAFELEKGRTSENTLATRATFLLEAYVPVSGVENVKNALAAAAGAVYCEFSDVPEEEMPPTLLKNNAVVEGFESLTNMYSVPNAREFDPNFIMAIFYSFFLGYIMADVGYGVLMMLGGGFLWLKNRARPTTLSRLACVFAVGGIFAIVWGVLFNSFFGIALLPFTVMPDAKDAMWSLAGIRIPSELILCMLFGIVHLGAGYVCKAVQCWRRKRILDGIFDGLVWAFFSVGMFLVLLGFIDEFELNVLSIVGGILAGAMLVVAMLTAGRKEKFFGKFVKGFGAAYGIINYVSDILSYARLYGLMLSGAVIANLISSYAVTGMNGGVGFLMSGNAGLIILGVFLILVGHAFNLAISLLGAYIHDARLQYVEFYGKFYEGEGELFRPLGSEKKYVRVTSD
ncbi:MAG: V-type ATP synthase subunit I [Clostridia bacterium]|nr:V-type ATP synthase subunit I [Clostridia bacterium]